MYDYCNDRNILQTRESLKTIDDEETLLIKYESNKKNEIIKTSNNKQNIKKCNSVKLESKIEQSTIIIPISEKNRKLPFLNNDSYTNFIQNSSVNESKFENDQEFIEFRKPSKKSFNESFIENSIVKNKYEVELFNLMKKDNFNKTNLFIYSKPFIKYLKLVSNRIEDSEFILIVDD